MLPRLDDDPKLNSFFDPGESHLCAPPLLEWHLTNRIADMVRCCEKAALCHFRPITGFIVALLQHELTFWPLRPAERLRLFGCRPSVGGLGVALGTSESHVPNPGRTRRWSLGRLLREREGKKIEPTTEM
jgi:hypothetical protein